jgi:transposase-like protein
MTKTRYTEKQKFEIVSAWQKSGMNQTRYALTIGLPSQTLNHWCIKYGFRRYNMKKRSVRKLITEQLLIKPVHHEVPIEEQQIKVNKLIREFKMHIAVFLFAAIYVATLYWAYSK